MSTYWTSKKSEAGSASTITLTTTTTIPAGASVTITLYEDVGQDGGANTDALGNGYDNSASVTLSGGSGETTDLTGFDGGGSTNDYWMKVEVDGDGADPTLDSPTVSSLDADADATTTTKTIGALGSKSAEGYNFVEYEQIVSPSEVTPSNPYDAVIESTLTAQGSGDSFTHIWYYAGTDANGDYIFRLRVRGKEVDTYDITTSSTDVTVDDGTGTLDVTSPASQAVKALRPLTHDGTQFAVKNLGGTTEARDVRVSHNLDGSAADDFAPFRTTLNYWTSNPTSNYGTNAKANVIDEHGANMRFDVLGGTQVMITDNDYPWSDEDPDLTSFDTLDEIMDSCRANGFDLAIWVWLDDSDSATPLGFTGGENGTEHDRLKRQMIARWGPRVEMSWLMYGFDLQEWATGSEVDQWAGDLKSWSGYEDPLLSGRGFAAESAASPLNPGNDDQGWIATNLDLTEWSTKPNDTTSSNAQNGMVTPGVVASVGDGFAQVLDQGNQAAMIDNHGTSKPHMQGERYTIERDFDGETWTTQRNRRYMWRSHLTLHTPGILGESHDGSRTYTATEIDQLKTARDFWQSRFTLGLTRDNALAPDADSWAVRESDNSRLIVYAEGTGSINVDLSGLSGSYAVTSVDTTAAYSENDEGTVSAGSTQTISLPSSSDWVLVLDETTDTTPPSLTSASAAADGTDGYSGSVDTDEGNGSLYHVVTQSSTAPSASQVKSGQNHNGSAADASGSQAISSTGTKSVGQTGVLSADTQYWVHYMHEDSAGNQSSVATAGPFTTDSTSTTSIAISGSNRVEDGAGNPVQNATVYATRVGISMQPLTATTDANGEATITGASAGETYRTWAEKGSLTTNVILRST